MSLGPMQLVRATIDGALGDLIAAGGIFDPATLHVGVYQALAVTGIDAVMADITPPTGAAAVRQPIVWGTPGVLADGSAVVQSGLHEFEPAGAEEGSVEGIYLANALVAGLLRAYAPEIIPVPISLGHNYSCVVRLVVDPTGRWSVSLSWNG